MSEPTSKPPVDPASAAATHEQPMAATPTSSPNQTPVGAYEKPIIRKYDQIDQVRPYGPSEI